MNVSKLYNGQVFKNYKELCSVLEMEQKTTNSRKAQMKELSRYCKYIKVGHKITVEEVYTEIRDKEENRGGNNNSIYANLVQLLILDLLARCEGHICISRSKLMLTIGMVNPNYSECRELIGKLSSFSQIEEKIIYDFYNISNGNFRGIVESSLNSLMNKRLIMYSNIIRVKHQGSFNIKNATPLELELIMEIEKDTLKEMGYKDISSIRVSKDWRKFRKTVKQLLNENSRIEFYFSAYDITVNEKHIAEECQELVEMILEQSQRQDAKDELNKILKVNIMKNAEKRHENGFTSMKKAKIRMSKEYLPSYKKLIDILVNRKTPNLLHEIHKVEEKVEELPFEVLDEIDKLFC